MCIKKFLLKIGFYNIKYRIHDWILMKRGYIANDYEPLKCTCGCDELDDCNEDYLDTGYRSTILEYDCRCTKCEKIIGHWAYGHWQR